MNGNGQGYTVQQRIHECAALGAASQPGVDRDRYFAEATGMIDARDGHQANPEQYRTVHERDAYARGYEDALVIARVKGRGTP